MDRVPGNWLLSPGFDYRAPVHTIEFWIEVFGFDKPAHLLENGFPVLAADSGHRGRVLNAPPREGLLIPPPRFLGISSRCPG